MPKHFRLKCAIVKMIELSLLSLLSHFCKCSNLFGGYYRVEGLRNITVWHRNIKWNQHSAFQVSISQETMLRHSQTYPKGNAQLLSRVTSAMYTHIWFVSNLYNFLTIAALLYFKHQNWPAIHFQWVLPCCWRMIITSPLGLDYKRLKRRS